MPSERRSRTLCSAKYRDTAPELTVRRLLNRMAYRLRLQRKDLRGKPGIVFRPRR